MKVLRLRLLVCPSLLFFTMATYGQNSKDIIGTWHDELKSTLVLTAISPEGRITGTYNTLSGTGRRTLAVFGWVNPDMAASKRIHVVPVIFSVWWNVQGNITVWSGYLSKRDDGVLAITTIWTFVHENADPDVLMDQTKANVTVFIPGPAEQ
jgi:hypothetical protein